MKKNIILCLSLVLMSLMAQAQNSGLSFRYGVRGGIGFASEYASGGYDMDSYRGYQFGAFVEMRKASIDRFFLRGSVLYAKKGVKYSSSTTTNQYIEIPIQIGYKYPALPFMSVYAVAGPMVNFRTYGNSYLRGFSSGNRWNAQNFGAGLEAGIGFEVLKYVQLEGSYQYGLTPDYKSNSHSTRNSSFLVSIGIVF